MRRKTEGRREGGERTKLKLHAGPMGTNPRENEFAYWNLAATEMGNLKTSTHQPYHTDGKRERGTAEPATSYHG